MKSRRLWIVLVLLGAALACLLAALPTLRLQLLGKLQGEPFVAGQPLSYWHKQIDEDNLPAAMRTNGDVALILVGLLDEGDAQRRSVASALAKHPDRQQLPLVRAKIAELFRRPEAERRVFALQLAQSLVPPMLEYTPDILERLRDPDRIVRRAARSCAASLRPAPRIVVTALLDDFRTGETDEREEARRALLRLDGDAFSVLVPLLGLGDSLVRDLAAVSGTEILPLLRRELDAPSAGVRIEACVLLARYPTERPIVQSTVLKLLRDPELLPLQRAPLEELTPTIGDPAFLNRLVEMLDDPAASVRRSAVTALGWAGQAACGLGPRILDRFRREDHIDVRSACILAFTRIPASSAEVPVLLTVAGGSEAELAQPALAALRVAGPTAIELSLRQLTLPAKEPLLGVLRFAARDANLFREYAESFVLFLADADPDVRTAAAYAVGSIGPSLRAAIPQLLRNLDEGVIPVPLVPIAVGGVAIGAKRAPHLYWARARWASAWALCRIEPRYPRAAVTLADALELGTRLEVLQALDGLARLGPLGRVAEPVVVDKRVHSLQDPEALRIFDRTLAALRGELPPLREPD